MIERQLVSGGTYSAGQLAHRCYELAAAAYPNGAPWRLATFMADIEAPQTHYDLLVVGEQPVGFVSWSTVLDETEITNVAIHPDAQRQGHAQWLLMAVLASLDKNSRVFLEVRASNVVARRLYGRCGFEQISTRKAYYQHPTEDALIMRKRIK